LPAAADAPPHARFAAFVTRFRRYFADIAVCAIIAGLPSPLIYSDVIFWPPDDAADADDTLSPRSPLLLRAFSSFSLLPLLLKRPPGLSLRQILSVSPPGFSAIAPDFTPAG
jgi:hypothetical protein